ncbi:hypothetical protein LUZ63_009700 [Rhynchospora breviuscula]|uniref:LysM domain-containing protein n=1 Tax=Rhynchospora breviuscula TaxID=2022672 RepID=A0A9Q0CFJ2_9POAL|nr:hypothetical protein LUZ63_009700 [Rhynchospora breviuscula]
MTSLSILLLSISFSLFLPFASAARFTCTAKNPSTCQSLVGYTPVNATTLGAVRSLFQLRSFRSLLAANSLPLNTPQNYTVPALSTVRVRFPCYCSGGSGSSFGLPVYKVRPGDGLDAIARGVFAGLVTYEEVAKANNISDPNRIEVGQQIKIPLPCSCDMVGADPVVHYAHVAAAGSSISGIATAFGTTEDTLMKLNGITDPKSLQAGQVLDVPLEACSSSISTTSLDRNMRVPNGSYVLTANNCIQCSCSSTTWQLNCGPTQGISSLVCPAAKCGDMYLGNTSSNSACDSTLCSYAGYTNSTSFTIFTNLTTLSVCNNVASPVSQPKASSAFRLRLGLSSWSNLLFLFMLACSAFIGS